MYESQPAAVTMWLDGETITGERSGESAQCTLYRRANHHLRPRLADQYSRKAIAACSCFNRVYALDEIVAGEQVACRAR